MKISDFEEKIKKDIDPDLSIRVNPNAKDIAGVYWKELYLGVSVPPEEIREQIEQGYTDKIGHPYKSQTVAMELIKVKLEKFKKAVEEEPELFA